jgi:TusA-related sulfurtransferase
MAGQAKKLIDLLVSEKAKGNRDIENFIRVKLSMKGIPVNNLTESSTDDPAVINKIKDVLKEFGVNAG